MQAQRVKKTDKGAITLDDSREAFFKQVEKECEEIRKGMKKGKKQGL